MTKLAAGVKSRRTRKRHPNTYRRRRQRYRLGRTLRVFAIYGGSCNCCGESDSGFLSLEHLVAGGAREKTTNHSNTPVYAKILRALTLGMIHPRYTVLCFNCNFARAHRGYCHNGSLVAARHTF